MEYDNITVKEIKSKLDQLDVEYSDQALKPELFELLANANATENGAVEPSEEPEATEVETSTGELSKAEYRGAAKAKQKKKKSESSNEVAARVIRTADQRKDELIKKLLNKKGYDWYRAKARTVLSDGRLTRPSFYYPIHKDEVERLGTVYLKTDKRASTSQLQDKKVKTDANGFIMEKQSRFVKETPEEGEAKREAHEEFDANQFVG